MNQSNTIGKKHKLWSKKTHHAVTK